MEYLKILLSLCLLLPARAHTINRRQTLIVDEAAPIIIESELVPTTVGPADIANAQNTESGYEEVKFEHKVSGNAYEIEPRATNLEESEKNGQFKKDEVNIKKESVAAVTESIIVVTESGSTVASDKAVSTIDAVKHKTPIPDRKPFQKPRHAVEYKIPTVHILRTAAQTLTEKSQTFENPQLKPKLLSTEATLSSTETVPKIQKAELTENAQTTVQPTLEQHTNLVAELAAAENSFNPTTQQAHTTEHALLIPKTQATAKPTTNVQVDNSTQFTASDSSSTEGPLTSANTLPAAAEAAATLPHRELPSTAKPLDTESIVDYSSSRQAPVNVSLFTPLQNLFPNMFPFYQSFLLSPLNLATVNSTQPLAPPLGLVMLPLNYTANNFFGPLNLNTAGNNLLRPWNRNTTNNNLFRPWNLTAFTRRPFAPNADSSQRHITTAPQNNIAATSTDNSARHGLYKQYNQDNQDEDQTSNSWSNFHFFPLLKFFKQNSTKHAHKQKSQSDTNANAEILHLLFPIKYHSQYQYQYIDDDEQHRAQQFIVHHPSSVKRVNANENAQAEREQGFQFLQPIIEIEPEQPSYSRNSQAQPASVAADAKKTSLMLEVEVPNPIYKFVKSIFNLFKN